MEKQRILQADYLDIVFDNRNKKYGGYELRKNYSNRAKRAVLGVLIGVSIICAVPVIASSLNSKPPVIASTFHDIVEVTNIPLAPKPEPKRTTAPAKSIDKTPAPKAPTVANPVPVIKPNDAVTNPAQPIDSLEGKMIGSKTNAGEPGGTVTDNGQISGTGGGTGDPGYGYVAPSPAPFAEVMPAFDGDLYSYLGKHIHYPQSAADRGNQGRTIIEFVVNEDGSLDDIKVAKSAGSNLLDAEAMRVVSAMPKWKPGKTKGKNVRVYFKLPVTFVLD